MKTLLLFLAMFQYGVPESKLLQYYHIKRPKPVITYAVQGRARSIYADCPVGWVVDAYPVDLVNTALSKKQMLRVARGFVCRRPINADEETRASGPDAKTMYAVFHTFTWTIDLPPVTAGHHGHKGVYQEYMGYPLNTPGAVDSMGTGDSIGWCKECEPKKIYRGDQDHQDKDGRWTK